MGGIIRLIPANIVVDWNTHGDTTPQTVIDHFFDMHKTNHIISAFSRLPSPELPLLERLQSVGLSFSSYQPHETIKAEGMSRIRIENNL